MNINIQVHAQGSRRTYQQGHYFIVIRSINILTAIINILFHLTLYLNNQQLNKCSILHYIIHLSKESNKAEIVVM